MSGFASFSRAIWCCLIGFHFLLVAARFDAPVCLRSDNDGAHRQVSYAGQSSSIIIEHSNRVGHRLLNFILAYITRDILGYEVDFNDVRLGVNDSLSADATLCRLSAIEAWRESQTDTKCKVDPERRFPASMINVEFWGLPGFNVERWVRMNKIIDAGPLGAFSRFGWFVPTAFVERLWRDNRLIADHFRVLTDSEFSGRLHPMPARCAGRVLFRSDACSFARNDSSCAPLYTSETNADIHMYLRALADRFRMLITVRFLNETVFEECISEALSNEANVLFFTYSPNPLTILYNVTRIRLPECTQILWEPRNQVESGRSTNSSSSGSEASKNANQTKACEDDCELMPCEVHQLTKVIWWPLRDSAKAVFQLLTKFSFSQADYDQIIIDLYTFLRHNATRKGSSRAGGGFSTNMASPQSRTGSGAGVGVKPGKWRQEKDRQLKEFACQWLLRKENEAIWRSWLGLQTNRDVVYLGGMFEMTGKWEQPGMLVAAALAIEHVRRAKDALPNFHASHTLALLARDTRCQADVAMEAFIYYVTGFEHNRANSSLIDIPYPLTSVPPTCSPRVLPSTGNLSVNATACEVQMSKTISMAPLPSSRDPLNPDAVVGILGPDVSDTADPVAHVAKHFYRVVLSPVAESYMLQDAAKYPYFLSVIPHRGLFTPIYVGFFTRMRWRRVAAITDNLHFVHFDTLRANEIEIFEHNLHSPSADAPAPASSGAGTGRNEDSLRRQTYVTKSALFLTELEKKKYRVILADIFDDAARIILCTAYHRGMTSSRGYVWIFPSWLSDEWWSRDVDEEQVSAGPVGSRRLQCTKEQMNEAADLHFTISPAFTRGEGDTTRLVNNATIKDWSIEYEAAVRRASQASKLFGDVSMKSSKFAGFAYDTVWLYALALDRLVSRKATILSELHNEVHANLFIETIKNISFEGATGLVRFNGTSRYGAIQLIQSVYGPRQSDRYRSRRSADPPVLATNGSSRKLGAPPTTAGIVREWKNNLVGVFDYDSGRFVLAANGRDYSNVALETIKWTNDGPPNDGSDQPPPAPLCAIENFRASFGPNLSCEVAIVIICFAAFFAFLFVSALIVFIMFRRKNLRIREMQVKVDKLRKLEALESELERFELREDLVVKNRCLGEGAFGMVYGGEALINNAWRAVAIKTLKQGASLDERMNFLAEAKLMSKFEHKNIVKLLGVCRRNEPVLVVMEFMLYGDLKTFLLARRALVQQALANQAKSVHAAAFTTRSVNDSTSGNEVQKEAVVRRERVRTCSSSIDTAALRGEYEDVSPRRLTRMALDVANALKYLATSRYVHRDVACRNCLISDTKTVKLADFGMCRLLSDESKDYYRFSRQGMLPVRWMSPESLATGHFSFASDVWSYGVLLYEVATFGNFPYQGRSNSEVMDFVKRGGTLEVPCDESADEAADPEPLSSVANPAIVQSALATAGSIRVSKAASGRPYSDVYSQTQVGVRSTSLANLMKSCWQYAPESRISIQRIVEVLEANPELVEPHVDQPYFAVPTEPSEVKVALTRPIQPSYSAGSPSLSVRSRAHPTATCPAALNVAQTPSSTGPPPINSSSRPPGGYNRQPSLSLCQSRFDQIAMQSVAGELRSNDSGHNQTQMWHSSSSVHALSTGGNLSAGLSLPGLNRIQVHMHPGTSAPPPAKNGSLSTLKYALFSGSKKNANAGGSSRKSSKLSGKLRKSSQSATPSNNVSTGYRSAGSPEALHRSLSQSNERSTAVRTNLYTNPNSGPGRSPNNLPLNALASNAAYINVIRMQNNIAPAPARPAALSVRSRDLSSGAYVYAPLTITDRGSPGAPGAKADVTNALSNKMNIERDREDSQETPESLMLIRRPDAVAEEDATSFSDNEPSGHNVGLDLGCVARSPQRDDALQMTLAVDEY